MVRVDVELGERGYPILIGPGLLARAESYATWLSGKQVLIVTNDRVGPLYASQLTSALTGCDVRTIVLPDGEAHKNLDSFRGILDALLAARFERRATVIALGGGVVGDVAGFAAACYQRGAGFIQVPTTLLAQVDSAVGGKTAVNHALGKNMIGAFYQPRCVIADTNTLTTLPERELRAGLAEVIKYGVIRDAALFDWLENNMERLLAREADALTHVIRRSCELKAEVVALDERELTDVRAILNYGHTFGHAIENLEGYGTWLHGEAVGVGMVLAADLSARIGWLPSTDALRIRALVARAGLAVVGPACVTGNEFITAMGLDKKVVDGRVRFVLARRIGEVALTNEVTPAQLRATLHAGDAVCEKV